MIAHSFCGDLGECAERFLQEVNLVADGYSYCSNM